MLPRRQKYRIIRELVEEGCCHLPPIYAYTIREVYHDSDGRVINYSEETLPCGTTRSDLQEELLKMINALIYPALDEDCEEIKD